MKKILKDKKKKAKAILPKLSPASLTKADTHHIDTLVISAGNFSGDFIMGVLRKWRSFNVLLTG